MPIDPCQCPSTIEGLLKAIYCTLYDIAENGAVVNLENISGISAFWKATLGGTPVAGQVFGTDGSGVFTTFDISDGGISILNINTPAEDSSYIYLQTNNDVGLQPFGVTDGAAAAPFVTQNGIVTSVT